MKRFLCLFLSILMILSMCACGGSGKQEVEQPAPQLEIGFGKVNITPSYSVGLSSSGDEKNRRSTGLISYVFATCIAVRFGGETYLVYTVDTISMPEELMKILRDTISSVVTEVKPENIFLAATHTHSAPANVSDIASSKYPTLTTATDANSSTNHFVLCLISIPYPANSSMASKAATPYIISRLIDFSPIFVHPEAARNNMPPARMLT